MCHQEGREEEKTILLDLNLEVEMRKREEKEEPPKEKCQKEGRARPVGTMMGNTHVVLTLVLTLL